MESDLTIKMTVSLKGIITFKEKTSKIQKIEEKILNDFGYIHEEYGTVYEKQCSAKTYNKAREHSLKINYLLNVNLIREQPSKLIA